jgi:integrating conjugative element protein (TIGR03756 family)
MRKSGLLRRLLGRALLTGLGLLAAGTGRADLDTASLLASAASLSCARIQPVGTCFWLVCTPFGCEVETSVKLGHYNPDLVVSATNGLGKIPWSELRAILAGLETAGAGTAIAAMGGIATALATAGGIGGGTAASPGQHGRLNLAYKEAQALGHPAAGQIYCPSAAQGFQPYYLSGLDAVGWRWQIPEMLYPESFVPGLREIGHWPANTWGAVYPRSGRLFQSDDPKVAAVLAQRVGDLVTRTGQPRIYTELESGGLFQANGKLAWRPNPLREGDARTGDWQRLIPGPSPSCAVFGRNDSASLAGWAGGKVAASGDYAWTLWRPYVNSNLKLTHLGC